MLCSMEIKIIIRSGDVNKYVMLMWLGIIPLLHGCDVKDPSNQPKTTTRSMIIGGVPVHDTDYKLAHTDPCE